MPIRVFLIDSHDTAREDIARLLESDGNIVVAGATADSRQALDQIVSSAPDVVIRDLTEPGLNGLDLVRRIHRELPECRILALTLHNDDAYIVPIVQAGASGSIVKDYATTRLITAVNSLYNGDVYFGQRALKKLAEDLAAN